MFRCEIRKRNINFTPRLSGDLPPLTVDKHKIQQALLNLGRSDEVLFQAVLFMG